MAIIHRRFGPRVLVKGKPARATTGAAAVPHIPTGFPALDRALHIGGLPKGRLCELVGPATSGKTTLALKFLAQAQAQAGGQVAYVDQALYFDPDYAHRCDVDLSRLLVGTTHDLGEALAITEALAQSGELAALVLDAMDFLWTDPLAASLLAATLLGSGLGLLVLLVLVQPSMGSWREQPVDPWKKLPQPPAPLSHFVADAYENTLDGQVYASTADGTLYALDCSGRRCVWSKREAIPPPTDAGESWCLYLDTEDRPRGMPTALGRVMDAYAWWNCVHDFWIDSHYILLDDGSVWVWESYEHLRFRIFDEKVWRVMRGWGEGGFL